MLNLLKNIDKLWWTVFVLNWYWDLPPEQQRTWDCNYCKSKKLEKSRNCYNRFEPTNIRLTGKTFCQQCPVSLIDSSAIAVYELINLSFNAGGMGGVGFLPTDLLAQPNIWFEYKHIISNAESSYKSETEDGKR